jgi:RNA polymerase sigma-70 factor (ECF subfamily)
MDGSGAAWSFGGGVRNSSPVRSAGKGRAGLTDLHAADATRRAARPVADELERHRAELTGYCYRMLGSAFEAEDAVQETMVRAWRSLDRFEGRAALRSWLYRIATNVCLDLLHGRKRRARPMDLGPAGTAGGPLGAALSEEWWIEPMPDSRLRPEDGDPAELAVARETVRLAFVAALQRLPPRQRAVLILREVLRWKASEVAELLGTSVASVNSALQRARATLDAGAPGLDDPIAPLDDEQEALLRSYVDAFERYDMDALVSLLREDATLSMPPYALWLRGQEDIIAWFVGPGSGCRGSRLVPVMANGCAGFGQYRPSPGGGHEPWALQVVELSGDRIARLNSFLDTARLFPLFGLPARLDS